MACASTGAREGKDDFQFPVGLRVLVVDDDPLCLMVVEKMLTRCKYKVTTCNRAREALRMLRSNVDGGFDLVLSDVYMPDMDGMKLLEHIGLELDLPVIIMSSNGETQTVLRGVTHGAVDYLVKPVRMEELRNIWQHVIRRKGGGGGSGGGARGGGGTTSNDSGGGGEGEGDDNADSNPPKSKKQKKDLEDDEDGNGSKKPRVVWSVELHQQFVNAVNQLGMDKAVPKRILDLMGVSGLTRENVASHLQKYRMYLKRVGTDGAGAMMIGPGIGGMVVPGVIPGQGMPSQVGGGGLGGMMGGMNAPMMQPPQGYGMIPITMAPQGMQMGVPSTQQMQGGGMVANNMGNMQPIKHDMGGMPGMSGDPNMMMSMYPDQYAGMRGGAAPVMMPDNSQAQDLQAGMAMQGGLGVVQGVNNNGQQAAGNMDDMLLNSFLKTDDGGFGGVSHMGGGGELNGGGGQMDPGYAK